MRISNITHLICIVCFALVFSGCSTFQGPGNYKGPSDPAENVAAGGETQGPAPKDSGDIAFDWPVEDARLSQPFHSGGKPHWGVDLAAPRGTDVFSSEKGYVVYTGRGFHGYGNLIVVEHSPEWATLYSHLDKILVKEGQFVKQGETIGKMGRTGRATGYHLHFEIRHNRQPVNPQAYLPPGM